MEYRHCMKLRQKWHWILCKPCGGIEEIIKCKEEYENCVKMQDMWYDEACLPCDYLF